MSIKVITRVWDSGKYEGSKLIVLLALADWAGDDGDRIFPAVQTLAKRARVSERTAQYILKQLRDDGVLEMIGDGKGGRGRTTEYRMNIELLERVQPVCTLCGVYHENKGCNPAQQRVQPSVKRVQPGVLKGATAIAPEPLEPSEEPLREPSTRARGFSDFWSAWRPFDMGAGNKQKAAESWNANVIKAGVDPDWVIGQAKAYCDERHRTRSKSQHAVTWLNQSGWGQDYGPPMSVEDMARAVRMEKYRRDEDEGEQDRNRELGYSDSGKRAVGCLP